MTPREIINSTAPIRICDLGGWTDTWFAGHGSVLNIAVTPLVEVQIHVWEKDGQRPPVVIDAVNYGESYCPLDDPGRHPLLEAAIQFAGVPADVAVEISIFSTCPGGCSTGTSAAVTVALLAALERLNGRHATPEILARNAQRVETELLGQQCGIQDQIASAHGGISFIDMHRYPDASVNRLTLDPTVEAELAARLSLIYAGESHRSSESHEMVIRNLEHKGSDAPELIPLRSAAIEGRDALLAGDLERFGATITANTEAQRQLHPGLIGARLQRIIDIARGHGVMGWKVNGAGGEGGSVTLLHGADRRHKRDAIGAILSADPVFQNIPVALSSEGVRVWSVRGATIIE